MSVAFAVLAFTAILAMQGARRRPPVSLAYTDYDTNLVYGAMMDLDKDYEWLRTIIDALNLESVRISAHWDLSEPEKGKGYDWSVADYNVESALRWGLEPILLITGTPIWANGLSQGDLDFLSKRGLGHFKGVMQPQEEHLKEYGEWVKRLARRFKGKVRYYEYWNEPDGMGWPILERDTSGTAVDVIWGGNSSLYARFLAVTYQAVKSVDPEAQVAVGGLESKTQFLRTLYECGANGSFDAVCIHPYGGGEEMGHGPAGQALNYTWVDEIRELMVSMGDGEKPIWVTEYGWKASAQDPSQMETKTSYLSEALRYVRDSPWITIAILHYLSGEVGDPWDASAALFRTAWKKVRWESRES